MWIIRYSFVVLMLTLSYGYAVQGYDRASVLVVTKVPRPGLGNVDYVLLARSTKTKEWSFFGHTMQGHDDAVATAAHALAQTLNTLYVLNMDEDDVRDYISLNNHHTAFVIDNSDTDNQQRMMTYITYFSSYKIHKLEKAFLRCIDYPEASFSVDAIALVRWENIEMALRKNTRKVYAQIPYRWHNRGRRKEKYRMIVLSDDFIEAVRPFFLRHSYKRGDDKRMRIYTKRF